MSRSIHANSSLRQRRQHDGTDWRAVHLKHEIKAAALRQRALDDQPLPLTTADAVDIRVIDSSPHLFFPASVADLRAVLEALPKGVTTGLREIRLGTGRCFIGEMGGAFDMVERSFGRPSVEEVPGVFVPNCMGVYLPKHQTIHLFGYTKAPALKVTRRQQSELELEMLTTLVHEVIHHHDFMHRMGRGRTRCSYDDKTESYTRRLTVRWVEGAVLPYLRGKYGDAVALRLARLVHRPHRAKWLRRGISRSERKRRTREKLARMPARKRRWVLAR